MERILSQRLELRQSCVVVNEAELKNLLGFQKLPKHMKSVPTISIARPPANVCDIAAADTGKQDRETLYCFDAGGPRTASMVTTVGVDANEVVLDSPLWGGHAHATMWAHALKRAEDYNSKVFSVSGRVALCTLESFVQSKLQGRATLKARKSEELDIDNKKRRVGAASVGAEDDDDDHAESGESSSRKSASSDSSDDVACSGDDATSSEAADAPKAVAPSKVASKAFSIVSGVTAPCSDVVPNSPEQTEQQKKRHWQRCTLRRLRRASLRWLGQADARS